MKVLNEIADILKRSSPLLCGFLILLTVTQFATGSPLPGNPVPIAVALSSPVQFGQSIHISWKLTNSSPDLLTGSFVYYIDSTAVTSTALPDNVSILPGKTQSGEFTFTNPGAGSHWFGVSLLRRTGTPTAHSGHPVIEKGETPSTVKPTAPETPEVSQVTIVASGSLRVFTSQPTKLLARGLTPELKAGLLKTFAPLLLYSYDHDQEEQYAPIDVVDYVHGSTFVSHESDLPNLTNAELQNASVILDPAPQSSDPTVKDAGTITTRTSPSVPQRKHDACHETSTFPRPKPQSTAPIGMPP
jgi:hypothetical protein